MGLTLKEITPVFSDEAAAYRLVESLRWPDGQPRTCPHCDASAPDAKFYFLKPREGARTRSDRAKPSTSYRRVWKCSKCRRQFSVLVGTTFSDSHIPLHKWLMAIHLMCSGKNGVSAHELHRLLGIDIKSAWYMGHRIRYAMAQPPLVVKLDGIVEADETYVGGKAKNMHRAKREATITGRGGIDKTPVFTLVARGGEVRSQVMHEVTGKNIEKVLYEQVSKNAQLMTDALSAYREPGKAFATHETVEHGAGEYVRGIAHINKAEGYFSQLKRSIDGTHHHVSARHLHRYLNEFDWRYNTRKMPDADRTVWTIQRAAGKRLTYR